MKDKNSPRGTLWLWLLLFAVAPAAVRAEGQTTYVIVGKDLFSSYCASCHGTEARGDGPVAEYLNVSPADLTQLSTRNEGTFPTEQVFQTIDGRRRTRGHGSRDMPIWGKAFKLTANNPDEAAVKRTIDELVKFLASIQEGDLQTE